MNQDMWKNLSEEEMQKATAALATIEGEIQADRRTAALAPVQAAYEAERNQIAASGLDVLRRAEKLTELKAKYRARGLQVY